MTPLGNFVSVSAMLGVVNTLAMVAVVSSTDVVCTAFNSAKIADALALAVAIISAAVFRTAINSAAASSSATHLVELVAVVDAATSADIVREAFTVIIGLTGGEGRDFGTLST